MLYKFWLICSVMVLYTRSFRVLTSPRIASSTSLFTTKSLPHVDRNIINALLSRVQECNDMGTTPNPIEQQFIPLVMEGVIYGYVPRALEQILSSQRDVFQVHEDKLTLTAAVTTLNLHDRTAAVAKVTQFLKQEKIISGFHQVFLRKSCRSQTDRTSSFLIETIRRCLTIANIPRRSHTFLLMISAIHTYPHNYSQHLTSFDCRCSFLCHPGWRDELLPVVATFSGKPALLMERAAMPLFGFKAYGVHVNGFVRDQTTGEVTKLWVAKRAKDKSTFPGMLDHIVAGGQPYGISPADNVIKECGEEANIPSSLAAKARAVGAVSYMNIEKSGRLKRDALFCYDIELPVDFVPTPVDGEVESFELQSLAWVLEKVVKGGSTGYKPNCNLVIIDFLIRHGVITPETEGYLELLSSLRRSDCF